MYLMSLLFFFAYFVCGIFFFFTFFGCGYLFEFFLFSFMSVDFSFLMVFDFLSFGFFSCVSFISSVVYLYSVFYMGSTVDMRRFLWLVFLFVLSMFILVFSGNFILTMVGWDGLGFVSFCLVIFYANSSSLESGLVTVFSNRVGDVFFLLSFSFFFCTGVFTWDSMSYQEYTIFLVFVFLGAVTKSAQVPFSAWLPAAMAAPTPVSSLVHSSTLVTAGVYVLIRFNYLFSSFMHGFTSFFFVLTMVLAGASASVESDFKKIVAMSTLSQLGMMMFILSVGGWVLSFVHMIIHAFFKSMLFLSTGSLMGQMEGTQDSRVYGSFYFSYGSLLNFVVSSLCLCGFPFFLGFYSKDFIISSSSFLSGNFLYLIFLVGCLFTVMYSVRLVLKSFVDSYKYTSFFLSTENVIFFVPVSALFVKGWGMGGFMYWFFLSGATFFFEFFDLFMGVILFFFGVGLYFFLKFFYSLFFSLSSIYFLRWKVSTGISFFFGKLCFSDFETTWMEAFGGGSSFKYLSKTSSMVSLFGSLSLGSLILFMFLFFVFWF